MLLFRKRPKSTSIRDDANYLLESAAFLHLAENQLRHPQQQKAVGQFHRRELQLGELLGEGGFASVYEIREFKEKSKSQENAREGRSACIEGSKAFQKSTGRCRYAVKHVKKSLVNHSQSFHRAAVALMVEARYLAAIDHPSIVKIRGISFDGAEAFGQRHDGFFVILDRLQETLDCRIRRWNKENTSEKAEMIGEKSSYALQIAKALEYLHQRRIIYRDLKPSNIGFKDQAQDDGRYPVQLFDFGLCRELPTNASGLSPADDATFLMSGVGTQRYTAVEIVTRGSYNLKADVYSWALLFYEMLALTKPFPHYSAQELVEFVCEIGERPSLSELMLPSTLSQLLQDSWAQDPSERLNSNEVCKVLEPIVDSLYPTNDTSEVHASSEKFLSNLTLAGPEEPRLSFAQPSFSLAA